jgi:hypothetical protein
MGQNIQQPKQPIAPKQPEPSKRQPHSDDSQHAKQHADMPGKMPVVEQKPAKSEQDTKKTNPS